ncbi:adenylate kinase 7 isoform X2 [Spodoptera frugiperda]|uniref:Adenylate kinase 7 isoform X2 n=1 Tax=Spodoptera frugiperda TaxID=7108 RepID=A0A9R0DKA7_SPOFR|nr:adenylate kinase 7 isoform X2 [Spodoptera frugiperda]
MNKSTEKLSSDKSSVDLTTLYSHKRYFINNVDSYHGEFFLKEVAKVFEKDIALPPSSSRNTSQSMLGEDMVVTEPPPPELPYEIIGTYANESTKRMEKLTRIVKKEDSIREMLTCGTVVFDISVDREELKLAMEYLTVLKELLEAQAPVDDDAGEPSVVTSPDFKKRYLILISTVMTWASTRPLDPDNTEVPFVETDFRKRKPHPNYKMHYDVENEVIGIARKYRKLIGALVVATGVTYGGKEDVLFYWFQKSWECEPILPILGRGNNSVPLINILDLGSIVHNLIVDFPKKLYILAVEQNVSKQRDIVKPLGRQIGSGMFKCIPPEDAFLIPEIDQRIYDLMTLNLNMEPTFIVETMGLQWTSEGTFADNIPVLMKQFKKERGLKPFKILVYGPPICGKTTLSRSLCDTYGLIYVSPETVAQDLLEDLTWRVNHWDIGETAAISEPNPEEEDMGMDDEDQGEDEGIQEQARQTLALLQSGRPLTDEEIMMFLRQKLLSREAVNRGWVLDGFPMTLAQCQTIFEKGDEQDSEAGEETREEPFDEDVDLYSSVLKKILPDIVVSLEATDDFICEKAMRQPEGYSRLDEETILKRLSEFRAGDTRENTPLNFFDELDIHPLVVPVRDPTDYGMQGSYTAVSLRMGRPCRYGRLLEIIEAAEKKEKCEQESLKSKEAKALKEREEKLRTEREEKMEYWTELYAMMREEEEAALAAAGEPMRNYLVHHIFPTLTPALLEVAKLRPDDPIDFLAEHLFKLNSTGKMLEPGYNLQAEYLLGKIKILDDALKDLDIIIEPLITPECEIHDPPPTHTINPMSAL